MTIFQRLTAAIVGLLVCGQAVRAAGPADAILAKGVDYLKKQADVVKGVGETALVTLALLKAGVPASDPTVAKGIEKLKSRCVGGVYKNDRMGGPDNYEAGLVLMVFTAADATLYYPQIETIAKYIQQKQTKDGCWDYGTGNVGAEGDTSMTQYALLGLWEAASAGVTVPLEAWDKAMHWLITRQDPGGGFAYHPRKPPNDTRVQQTTTHTMGAAGAGSLLICQSQLPFRKRKVKIEVQTELLIPVEKTINSEYQPVVTSEKAEEAIQLANRWMSSNMTVDKPTGEGGHCYFLYAVERYAELAKLKTVGKSAWYEEGAEYLGKKQSEDGSWRVKYDAAVDTSFAVLFLGRSTQKTLKRIQISMLGKGVLLGGRGMPDPNAPVSSIQARQKDRYRQALRAPVEDLLSILEDPTQEQTEEAAAAMETVDPQELIAAIKGNLGKLRRLAGDSRPAVRRGAMWALARTKDYRTVPILIRCLSDRDPQVYEAARGALALLSRQVDAFGLPAEAPSPQQLAEGIARAQRWFATLRVKIDAEQEFDE